MNVGNERLLEGNGMESIRKVQYFTLDSENSLVQAENQPFEFAKLLTLNAASKSWTASKRIHARERGRLESDLATLDEKYRAYMMMQQSNHRR